MTARPLLFVSGEYPPDVGGVSDYTCLLRGALVAAGWHSSVLTRHHVKRWDLRSLAGLLRASPKRGLVHIQYQAAAFDLLGDVCLMPVLVHLFSPGVKVVTTFHDARVPYLFPKAGGMRRAAVRLLARSSDAVIAADARDLAALGVSGFTVPIGSNARCTPPPGYDRDAFRRARIGADADGLVVAYFGLLNGSKGLDVLFDAFDHLPHARLLLLGGEIGASDPTNAAVAARVRARLNDRVMQTGWLPPNDLSAYLLAADVALLPYADGASGRRGSLLACAEHGLPVVSTQPAAPEVADAIVAVPQEPALLAEAVLDVAANPAPHRARSRALAARHSWPQIAAEHVRIYESLA